MFQTPAFAIFGDDVTVIGTVEDLNKSDHVRMVQFLKKSDLVA